MAFASVFSTAPMSDDSVLGRALTHNWWVIVLRGLLGVLFGLISLFLSGVTMLSLVLVFAAYTFLDGIFSLVATGRAIRDHRRWGILLLQGVVSLIAAAIAFFWPGITVIAFVLLTAAWALISAVVMTSAAFHVKKGASRWWLIIGAIAGLLYAVATVIAPLTGALVLTWWIGAYALVFGVSLVVLGFRLRSRDAAIGSHAHA